MSHFDYLRADYLDSPYEISLETLALCNAACTFCPYPTLDRKGQRMDDNTISHLLLQMAELPKPFFFSPFKVNEPLLDSRLIPICRQFNQLRPDSMLRLFTNGAPLTGKKIDEIASLQNVAHLWVSLNSVDPAEYRSLMALDFETTARKLDLLHKAVEAQIFPHPVMLSRVTAGNEQDAAFIYGTAERWPAFQRMLIKRDGWLGYVDPGSPEIPATPCARWFELSILATGIVSLCCMDGRADYPIGNIHHSTLLEVYNAPHWRARREAMISRTEVHPCSTCTY